MTDAKTEKGGGARGRSERKVDKLFFIIALAWELFKSLIGALFVRRSEEEEEKRQRKYVELKKKIRSGKVSQ